MKTISIIFLLLLTSCVTATTTAYKPSHTALMFCAGYAQIHFDHERELYLAEHPEAAVFYAEASKQYPDEKPKHDYFHEAMSIANKLDPDVLEEEVIKCTGWLE